MSKRPLLGCCADLACDESNCMRLPTDVHCRDCMHVSKCVVMFGKKPDDDTCDFFPRKFKGRAE